jgi:hypothetical protein
MKFVLAILFFVSSSIACTGGRFFSHYGTFFWSGFDSLCFESDKEEVFSYLQRNIKEIENGYGKFRPKKHLQIWSDSTSRTAWWWSHFQTQFNSNQFYGGSFPDPADYDLGYFKSYMAGISTIYVGNKETKDTVLAFSFYEGSSTDFQKIHKGKYSRNNPVFGLFSVSIKYDRFKENYLTKLMEGVGFGRTCGKDITVNCFDMYNEPGVTKTMAGGKIKVEDPDIIVEWGTGDLFRIKLKANYATGFRVAMRDNTREWIEKNKYKYPALKSN